MTRAEKIQNTKERKQLLEKIEKIEPEINKNDFSWLHGEIWRRKGLNQLKKELNQNIKDRIENKVTEDKRTYDQIKKDYFLFRTDYL